MFITTAGGGMLAATVAGGLLGGSGASGGTQTTSQEPWAPAQPWLQDQITTGQNLQNYYQSNPLNSMQQQGYQNLTSGLDNYQSNVAPALQAVANRLMGSNYSRTIGQQNYSQPSSGFSMPTMGQGGMGQGSMQTRPMMQTMQSMPQQAQHPTGLLGPAVQQQFSQPQMDVTQGYTPYGLLNFSTLLPDVNKLNEDAKKKKDKDKESTSSSSAASIDMPGGA